MIIVNPKYQKLVDRFNDVLQCAGAEYNWIANNPLSELEKKLLRREIDTGKDWCITLEWMYDEVEFWYEFNNEPENDRYERRLESKENYKLWVSDNGKMKRLLAAIQKAIDKREDENGLYGIAAVYGARSFGDEYCITEMTCSYCGFKYTAFGVYELNFCPKCGCKI